ncbi:MAG: signal peptidase I [Candidatus Moranbacteria bacterium]|jgi:signal peptidase|nr:signal peptidase I [Candidatus Moranbacteria bacterium]
MIREGFKIILNTILAIIFSFGILVIFSFLPIPGNMKLLTVLSGSMEPRIHTGSLIFIKPASEYNVGDIVTKTTDEKDVTVTHRIIEKEMIDGKAVFVTKGDANNADDNEKVPQETIIGKVFLNIPYLGYAVNFAKTKEGLILIVIIPAVIIVYEEILKIKKEIVRIAREKREKREPEEIKNIEFEHIQPQYEEKEEKRRKVV